MQLRTLRVKVRHKGFGGQLARVRPGGHHHPGERRLGPAVAAQKDNLGSGGVHYHHVQGTAQAAKRWSEVGGWGLGGGGGGVRESGCAEG